VSARKERGFASKAAVAALALASLSCSRTTELLPTPVEACVAPGPPIRIGGTDAQSCTGALAARYGRYALCSCNDLTLTGMLAVGGPGGPQKPGGAPGPGAPAPLSSISAVGTDGNLRVNDLTEVEGSLVTAGTREATFVRGGHVQGNLRGGGGFTTMTTMGVWVSGEMSSAGDVSGLFKVVGGPLRVPSSATVTPDVQSMGVARQPVSVPGPCGCGASSAPDLVAAVAERKTRNLNPTLSFPVELLASVEEPEALDIPCGEFYLPELRATDAGSLELRVHGRAAIFVAGDVHLGNNLTVTLDEGAELDLVVAGLFDMTGGVFGSSASPARVRLWVGGTRVSLPPNVQFSAAVYAPDAVFSAGLNLRFSGSLYVGALSVSGDVRIAYDPRVTQGGALCGAPPPMPVD
jgi:hypothetical protein